MSGTSSQLEKLGADVAAAQDRALETRPLPSFDWTAAAPRRWRVWWVTVGALGAVASLVALVLVLELSTRSLSIEINGAAARDPSAWISVTSSEETPLRFSDGSTLLLGGGSRTRVIATTPHGAHVQVERGRVVVSVVRRDAARWQLDVGPFTVQVTGTRFDVAWDAAEEIFSLTMQEGSVHVQGPDLSDRVLVAGQSMVQHLGKGARAAAALAHVSSAAGTSVSPDVASAEALSPPSTAMAPDESKPEAVLKKRTPSRPPVSARMVGTPGPTASRPATLRELYDAGKYSEVIANVRAGDLQAVLAAGTADDLIMVGDAARLVGDTALSRQALEATRQRFPGSAVAARACFLLGRLSFDVDARPDVAATLFARYLEDAPRGPLAREALGRLVEALSRAGDRAGAQSRARQYLDQYPNGPHAAFARSLL